MELIEKLTFAVEDGNMSALDAYIQLHQIEKLAGEARKQIQAQAVTEAQREGKQRVMTNGEWERLLRTDPRYGWEKTENAKAEAKTK